jgi:hypothetical protein
MPNKPKLSLSQLGTSKIPARGVLGLLGIAMELLSPTYMTT